MSKTINISLPEELVRKIDQLAKGEYASRSDFIRETLVRRIKGQRIVDEWGDPEGVWEQGVDLRDAQGNGMPVTEVLEIIHDIER
jgi:Arc/MetJ-type ribon-helix-helix transcriptional regulator